MPRAPRRTSSTRYRPPTRATTSGLPVYQLLGSASRDGLLAYGHASGKELPELFDSVHEHLEEGLPAIRIQSCVPGLKATGMTGLADRDVDEFSGGQRQRAWIAMAVAQETGPLLLDEPTAYLDIAHQLDVLGLVAH